MNPKIYLIISFSIFYNIIFAQKSNFFVNVSGVKPNAGNLFVAIHVKENYLSKTYYATQVVKAKQENQQVEFYLPKGTYAVAIYQDFNGNQILDKNMLGVPQEPYAFSNGVRPKFRAPTFDEAKVLIGEKPLSVNLKLAAW